MGTSELCRNEPINIQVNIQNFNINSKALFKPPQEQEMNMDMLYLNEVYGSDMLQNDGNTKKVILNDKINSKAD